MSQSSFVYDIHARFCRVIANPHRLRILALLEGGERSVSELADEIGISVANVSQHLRVLRDSHVVKTRRDARTVFYSLTDRRLPKVCRSIRAILVEGMKKRGETMMNFEDY